MRDQKVARPVYKSCPPRIKRASKKLPAPYQSKQKWGKKPVILSVDIVSYMIYKYLKKNWVKKIVRPVKNEGPKSYPPRIT